MNCLLILLTISLFFPHQEVCGILVPQPRNKPSSPVLEDWHGNHWTTREVFSSMFEFSLLSLFWHFFLIYLFNLLGISWYYQQADTFKIFFLIYVWLHWAFLVAQTVKNPPATQETWVRALGWEDPLEEGMETHSSILAWRIPMDRGAWWSTVHRVPSIGHDRVTKHTSTAHGHTGSLLVQGPFSNYKKQGLLSSHHA